MGDPQQVVWDDQSKAAPPAAASPSAKIQWDDAKTAAPTASAGPRIVTKPQTQSQIDSYMGPQSTMGQFAERGLVTPETGKAIKDIGSSFWGAVKSVPQGVYNDVKGGHVPLIHSMITEPAKEMIQDVPQVAGAVKDINASPDPVGTYLHAAGDTASQGAGQALAAIAADKLPKAAPAAVRGAGRVLANPYVASVAGPAAVATIGHSLGLPLGEAAEGAAGVGLLGGKSLPKLVQSAGYRMSEVGLTPEQALETRTLRIVDDLNKQADQIKSRMDVIKKSGGEVPDSMQTKYNTIADKIKDQSKSLPAESPFPLKEGKPAPSIFRHGAPDISEPDATGQNKAYAGESVKGRKTPAAAAPPAKPVPASDLPSRPPEPQGRGPLPDRSYNANPNIGQEGARIRVKELMEDPKVQADVAARNQATIAKYSPSTGGTPSIGETPQSGAPSIAEAPKEKFPVKISHDTGGNIVDADGRHRIIDAIKRGDTSIDVEITAPDGTKRVNSFDPRQVAKRIGVTEESLKATDAQETYRDGSGKPRVMVTETSPDVKQVGIRGESKAARAIAEQTGEGHVSQGQFSKVNGPRIEAAITDAEGTKYGSQRGLRNDIHAISAKNGDLGRTADALKVDIGDLDPAASKNRQEIFNRMLDAGRSPEEIAAAYRSLKR